MSETESAGVPGHPGVVRRSGAAMKEAMRPSMKGEMRPESEKVAGPRKTRLHSIDSDKLALPKHLMDPDMTYEWKTFEVYGKEMPWHIQEQTVQGFEPCSYDEFPGFAPAGMKGNFVKEGLMLMKRPKYLTEEYKQELLYKNQSVIANRMELLGETQPGEFGRKHPKLANRVSVTYERPVEIED